MTEQYAKCPRCKKYSITIETETGDYVCIECGMRFEYYCFTIGDNKEVENYR